MEKIKVGDVVYTDTHAVYQDTQESLSRLKGVVINDDDPYDIHVNLCIKDGECIVGFSEFELSLTPITVYKNE